jgi:hypothetical protein
LGIMKSFAVVVSGGVRDADEGFIDEVEGWSLDGFGVQAGGEVAEGGQASGGSKDLAACSHASTRWSPAGPSALGR